MSAVRRGGRSPASPAIWRPMWKAIEVAHELSKSPNAKIIVLRDKSGLPIIFSDK